MKPDQPFKGALLLVLGEGLLAVMAAMIKHLADTLPVEMIVFGRNLIGLAVLLPVLVASGGIRDLRTSHLRLHFIRGFTGVTAMFCFFFTIAHIPLAEAVLVKMTVPFFLPLVAWLWLNDRISGHTWAAIVLGFVGVGVILRADEGVVDPVMLVALAGAAIMSVAKVSIRRMAASEPPHRVVFYFSLFATLLSALLLLRVQADAHRHRNALVAGDRQRGDRRAVRHDHRLPAGPPRPGGRVQLLRGGVGGVPGLAVLGRDPGAVHGARHPVDHRRRYLESEVPIERVATKFDLHGGAKRKPSN